MSGVWNEHLAPRSPYEAIDFGFLFARAHYLTLVGLAATLVLPVAIVLPFVVPGGALGASLVVFWAKPFWERPILVFLSRALFEEPRERRAILADWRSWAARDLLPFLTWRRLSPTRSFDLPITLLEGSRGAERGARLGALHRGRFPGAAVALTTLLLHVEVVLQLGLLALLALAIPESADFDFVSWFFDLDGEAESSVGAEVLSYAASVVAALAIAPFYVGAGFSLYLHRRTELEAWDLEVAFRRLADRASTRLRRVRPRAASGAAPSAVLLAVFLFGGATSEARAIAEVATGSGVLAEAVGLSDEAVPPLAVPLDRAGAREAIEAVLAGEDFHALETMSLPRFLHELELDEPEDESGAWPEWLVDLFDALARGIAGSVEVVAVALLVLVLGWILLRFVSRPTLEGLGTRVGGARRVARPRELFGMEITEGSLPDDVVGEARAIVRAGGVREALALLYRAALSRLVLQHGADLSRGRTERECVAIATPLLPADGGRYFTELTAVWLRCAYGHLDPDRDLLEGLCRDWSGIFDPVDAEGEGAS